MGINSVEIITTVKQTYHCSTLRVFRLSCSNPWIPECQPDFTDF